MFRASLRLILNSYPSWLCRREFRNQKFTRLNERPVEYSFVFRQLAALCPRTVLDVGTGNTALPHLIRNCGPVVSALDNIRDYWPRGMFNRHYHVIDDDITDTKMKGSFDLITCVSVLEHIIRHDHALRNMSALLKHDGHLLITCPYHERAYCPNVYALPGSSYGQSSAYVCQAYSRENVQAWLEQSNAQIVEQEYWRYWDGEYWTVGSQTLPPERVDADEPHQLTCLLLRKNA